MADDDAPPAYQETATSETPAAAKEEQAADGGDGPATSSSSKSSPNEPGPEEGALGSPLKRVMYIGVVLILYFILAFWIPVYMMAGAADPCNRSCTTLPYTAGGCVDAPIEGVPTGFDSETFETIYTPCDAYCEDACDVINDDKAAKQQYNDSWALSWLSESIETRLASWSLIVLGMVFGLIGCIIAYFAVKKANPVLIMVSAGLLGLGGVLLGIGGLVFNVTWYLDPFEAADTDDFMNAWRAANTFEFLLPAAIAVIIALDLLPMVPISLNDEKKRMMIMTAPFAAVGISAGFCYAYIANWEPDNNATYDFELKPVLGCMSAGYFIFGLMAIARILIFGEFVKVSENPAQVIMIKFVVTILLVIGAFICAVGYWAYIDALFECDYSIIVGGTICENAGSISYIFGDLTSPSYMTLYDLPYEGNLKSYYVGYSFLVLGMGCIMAYDMGIVENYKAVAAAQKAAAATNA